MVVLASRETHSGTSGPSDSSISWSVPAWFARVSSAIVLALIGWLFLTTLNNTQRLAEGGRYTQEEADLLVAKVVKLELKQDMMSRKLDGLPPQELKDKVNKNTEMIIETRALFSDILVSLRILENKVDSALEKKE